MGVYTHAAQAATIYSNSSSGNDTTGDGSSGNPYKTFYKAYTIASANDTINLTGTFSWTDADETGDATSSGYTLGKNLTIVGQSANTTIIQAHSTAGSADRRVFTISSSVNITFQNLAIRHGYITSGSGAGISGSSGTLTIQDCTIIDNDASGSNVSGGVVAGGDMLIERSSFINNNGTYVNALYNGAGATKTVTITNSTFYGNSGGSVGTVYFNGTNSVVTNSIFTGGGSYEVQGTGSHAFKNTIILDNNGVNGLYYYNYSGTVSDNGNNIIGGETAIGTPTSPLFFTSGVNGTTGSNKVAASVTRSTMYISSTLSEHGSSNGTLTVPLLTGSTAIDGGSTGTNSSVSVPITDQRGQARSASTDIGPFEYQGGDEIDPAISSVSLNSNNAYFDLTFTEAVYGDSGASTPVGAEDLTITAFTANGGAASAVSISSVTKTDNGALTGGETTIRVNISVTGSANGVETFKVKPTNSVSIYDAVGNPMSSLYQLSSAMTLNGYFHYYVDPSGTNDGSHGTGTGTDAWQTIQYAVSNVSSPTTAPIIIHISGHEYDLNSDDISIDRDFTNLIVRGDGADSTIVEAESAAATATNSRVFTIGSTENVTLESMTIRYGYLTSGNYAALSHSSGTLIIRDAVIDSNSCTGSSCYGGIYAGGTATIEDTTISNNTGLYTAAGYFGGSNKTVTITNVTFSGNTGGSTAALYINGPSTVYITNSLFTKSGALFVQAVSNIYYKNSIFVDNPSGYDIDYYNFFGTGHNNGGNIIGVEDSDGSGPIITNGVNGSSVVGNGATLTSLNINNTLATNSSANGTTTHALETGSSAIDAGVSGANGSVSIPSLDQRGASRAGTVDIGPYEYNGVVGAPTLSSTYPADDATGAAANTNLILTFSEAVNVGTGNVTIKKTSDNSTVEAISVLSGQVTGSGTDTITIDPTSNLADLTSYYVQIDATAFTDGSSNAYAGIADATSWNFTTGDTTSPVLTLSSPTASSSINNVTTSSAITFSTNEALGSGSIVLTRTSGTADANSPHTCTLNGTALDSGSHTISLADTTNGCTSDVSNLVSGAVYTIVLSGTDTTGNVGTSTTVTGVTFDTVTQTPTLISPSSTSSQSTLQLTYTLPETASSVNVVFNNGVTTTVLTMGSSQSVNTTVNLANLIATAGVVATTGASLVDGTYTVTLGYQDVLLNPANTAVSTNVVIDTTAPTLALSSPTASSSINNVTTSSAITFSTNEALGSGSIVLTRTSGTADANSPHTCTLNGTALDSGSHTISLADTTNGCTSDVSNLVSGAVYTAVLSGSDAVGNAATQVTATNVTFDNAAPTISSFSPADDATNITTAGNLVLTFNENVYVGTGNITIKKTADDSTLETIGVTSGVVTGSGSTTITINPSANLNPLVSYYVQIPATAFVDAASNAYAGIANTTTWNFTTESAAVTVSQPVVQVAENSFVDRFSLSLTSQPTNDVTIHIENTTGVLTFETASLTFTPSNWSTPQSVFVSVANDSIDTGVRTDTINFSASSSDGNYNGIVIDTIAGTILDDDHAGITVSTISGDTTEDGGEATFTVVLNSEPTDDVSIGVASSDTTEGSVSPSSLVLSADNWDVPQTVTVTGVDDTEDDGDVEYGIQLAAATSADTLYNGIDPSDSTLSNLDNNDSVISDTPTIIERAEKNKGTITIIYKDDDSVTSFQPFEGNAKFVFSVDPENDAVLATDGKYLRVFVNGETVSEIRLNKKSISKRKFAKLKVKQLFNEYNTVLILTASKRKGKLFAIRLDEDNQLSKKVVKKVSIVDNRKVKLKVRKKRVITSIGKGEDRVKKVWKIQSKGDLRLVSPKQ